MESDLTKFKTKVDKYIRRWNFEGMRCSVWYLHHK